MVRFEGGDFMVLSLFLFLAKGIEGGDMPKESALGTPGWTGTSTFVLSWNWL